MEELRSLVREVPDFPKPGILFYDITTVLKDPRGLALVAEKLAATAHGTDVDLVAGMESRGFLFGPLLALRLGTGFALMRKPGKLPRGCDPRELRPRIRNRRARDPQRRRSARASVS